MQHQALKYAPSLVTDGQFTQGLSHWFGSYVAHTAVAGSVYAKCTARSAEDYAEDMPYGISQFIDAPEMHRYPARRSAELIQMIPLGTKLALLVATANSTLQGRPLAPGTVGVAAPNDVFQHPFRWQDNQGAVNIEPTSKMLLEGAYSGEYRAGQLLLSAPAGATKQDILYHRLYVAPEGEITPGVSSAGFGGVRVEVDIDNEQLIFIGPPEEIPNLRTYIASRGTTKLVGVIADEYQVALTSLGQLSNNSRRFSVGYSNFLGGVSPDRIDAYADWALFVKGEVSCAYTMPLYGYEYTLAYNYQGRKPKPAEINFLKATETSGSFSLSGFGEVALRVLSDTTQRMVMAHSGGQPRVLEVLRGESRVKVAGRARLTIPVLDAPELQESARAVLSLDNGDTFFARVAIADAPDPDGRVFNGVQWYEGSGTQPGRMYLAGAYNPSPTHTPNQLLGQVVFTGHLAGPSLASSSEILAKILYGQPDEVTAQLFVRGPGPGSNNGAEVYATFQVNGQDVISASQVGLPGVDRAFDAIISQSTIRLRGDHYGNGVDAVYPRIQPQDSVVFDGAPEVVEFLNNDQFTVDSVSMNGVGALSIKLPSITTAQFEGFLTGGLLAETRVSLPATTSSDDSAYINDVGMWSGDLTAALPLEEGSARDMLARHTDPLNSLFPKGTVMLYAGGGTCPAGFKPVQATAGSAAPGVPGVGQLPPLVASNYDPITDLTTLEFSPGQLPYLRDASGEPVSADTPAAVTFPAPSLEFGNELSGRTVAQNAAGDPISISNIISRFRYAVEPGMVIRVEESVANDGAPLTAEDRGFLVVGDDTVVVPTGVTQASAKRPLFINGQNGYESRSSAGIRDVSGGAGLSLTPGEELIRSSASEYYGTGFGTVQYPAADVGRQAPYNASEGGFSRVEDQALTDEYNQQLGLEGFLLPKYPTRFSQQPNFSPLGPGIWGQRERFFYETHDQLDPTDLPSAPSNRIAPAVMLVVNSIDTDDNEINIGTQTGAGGVPGIPHPGSFTFGYLPNPAWDLSDPGSIDVDAYPPIPVNHNNDLMYAGSSAGGNGRVIVFSGMVFYCRIYARCDSIDQNGRPTGTIRGWFDELGQFPEANDGVPFLFGTCLMQAHAVEDPADKGANINMRLYTAPANETLGRYDGLEPFVTSASWPAPLPPKAILQLTPAALYGPAGQPQEYGEGTYVDFDNQVRTYVGRKVAAPYIQDDYTYTRQEQQGGVVVTAQYTAAPSTSIDSIKVAGDLSGAFTVQPRMFVEPSGYLKYGQTGASLDYGPGRHGHEIARTSRLLGQQQLAQPEASQDYLTSLPTNHGHGKAGEGRYLTPVANLFTSCIKL